MDGPTNPMVTPLLTDLYQFTMAYAYWKSAKHNDRAVYISLILLQFSILSTAFLLKIHLRFSDYL